MPNRSHRKGTPYDRKQEQMRKSKKKQRKKKNRNQFGKPIKGKQFLKINLILRDGQKCAYCYKEDVELEIEHLIPRSKGGSNKMKNLVLSCRECNVLKGNKMPGEIEDADLRDRVEYLIRYARSQKK